MSYFADLEIREAEAEWEAGWFSRQVEYAKADAAERQKETDLRSALLKASGENSWIVWFEKATLNGSPSLKLIIHFDSEQNREEFLSENLTHLDLFPPSETKGD